MYENIIAIIIDGASNSSAPNEQQLSVIAKKILPDRNVIELSRSKKEAHKMITGIINTFPSYNFILYGKSLGAIRIAQWLKKNHKKIENRIWRALLIDPHSPFVYGAFKKSLNLGGVDLAGHVVNDYQTNEWPKGCKIIGAQNMIEKYKCVNHFNISKIRSHLFKELCNEIRFLKNERKKK